MAPTTPDRSALKSRSPSSGEDRLHRRHPRPPSHPGDAGGAGRGTVIGTGDGGDQDLGVVPRHVRVVPLHPGDAIPVGDREGDEVGPLDEGDDAVRVGRGRPVERDRHHLVRRLAVCGDGLRGVVLRDRHQPLVVEPRDLGEAQPAGEHRDGGQRHRIGAGVDPVQPLVVPIGEHHDALPHRPGPAAVLVHLGADVPGGAAGSGPGRGRFGSRPGPCTNWLRPPSSGRDSLHQTSFAVGSDLPDRGDTFDQLGRRDRRRPRAERQLPASEPDPGM